MINKRLGHVRRIFYFENELYIQIDGVAMGLALAFIIVNAFLCHIEEWLQNWLLESKLVVCRGCNDDIFVLSKIKEHLPLLVNYDNSKHRNIKFIFDFENNENFYFLDVRSHV